MWMWDYAQKQLRTQYDSLSNLVEIPADVVEVDHIHARAKH